MWVWSYIDRNGSKRAVFMNPGKKIKFRVTAEYFFVGRPENSQEIDKPFFCKVPYSVTVRKVTFLFFFKLVVGHY